MERDYLKDLRRITEELRRIPPPMPGRPKEEFDKWAQLEARRQAIARRSIGKDCFELGTHLFDANHFLEKAGQVVEGLEETEYKDEEDIMQALEHLEESLSYYSMSQSRGFITKEEHGEIKRYIEEGEKAIGRKDMRAGEFIGDADRLAKSLLFNKLISCSCKIVKHE